MARYYFPATALPALVLGVKPEISFKEAMDMLSLNLTASDFSRIALLLRPIDLYNIRAFWLGFPLDERGNFTGKELEEALLVPDAFPSYVIAFLERYDSLEERLRYFPSLYASLFQEGEKLEGFLGQYYALEREMRLVLVALRAKQKGSDLVKELQYEDPSDPLVAQILVQRDVPDYAPPQEYEDLKALFKENLLEPNKLQRALLEYRFHKIEEMEQSEFFTLDQILAYLARLILVESWISLDREKGMEALEELGEYG